MLICMETWSADDFCFGWRKTNSLASALMCLNVSSYPALYVSCMFLKLFIHSFIHVVLSARSSSAVMALHKVLSFASLTHSAYDLLLVHPLISSIHILLGLPRCLLPSTFPSSNNVCKELLRIMWPKYYSFLFIMIFNKLLLHLAMFNTSSFVLWFAQAIFRIRLNVHISNASILFANVFLKCTDF